MNHNGVTDMGTAKSIARKLFASYTYGHHDYLDKSAMQRMMIDTYKILNKDYRPTSQDVGVYNQVLDFNGDGRITVSDFEALAVKYLVKPETRVYTKSVKQRLEVARRLFQRFDTDRSGYLSENQIPNLLIQTYRMLGMEFEPTREDTESWMKMADLDGDGRVTLEDYERLIISSLEKCGIKIFERE